ncbi:unnamed protein product [Arctogadus glacialis]
MSTISQRNVSVKFPVPGIDSQSPGNDCHTSAKSQPSTGADHIKQGPLRGPLLVNRGSKHLLILTYRSAADTYRWPEGRHIL